MIRRKFLGLVTMTGAGGIASTLMANAAAEKRTAIYKVDGFTCVTCAVGLETLLQREKGILTVHATYPEGVATIAYDPRITNEAGVSNIIQEMGFHPRLLSSSTAS